jgi:hypothetical protein
VVKRREIEKMALIYLHYAIERPLLQVGAITSFAEGVNND